jgi:hypothetical protein
MNGSPLEFQAYRKIMDSARFQLETLEDLESDYNDAQTKMLDTIEKFDIPQKEKDLLKSVVYQGCVFTPNKLGNLRKRILDKSNAAYRELSEEFKKYKVTL